MLILDKDSDDEFDEKRPRAPTFFYDQPYKIDDANSDFSVSNPVKAGHVTYTVKGRDDEGDFEGSRRYKDFNALRSHLVSRWPGVFIPSMPPKQSFGNK